MLHDAHVQMYYGMWTCSYRTCGRVKQACYFCEWQSSCPLFN